MKTKITFLLAFIFVCYNTSFAQQDEECMTKLSIFHEYTKAKNYDAAYEPWMAVRNKCPKFNNAIYIDGEKILDHKIDTATGADKIPFINDYVLLLKQRAEHFPGKTKIGENEAKSCQIAYDNKKLLGKTDIELYECFDAAYNKDKDTFTNPKSLYTYFSLMVDLYDTGAKPAKDLFNKYDDIVEKIDDEVKSYSENLNKIVEKEDAGTVLTNKEKSYKKYYESYLNAYDQIASSIDSKLGERANCTNLVPLYEKDFEANKSDAVWLKRAVSKMYHKECTDAALYEKLVKAYDETSPSADTKYFVATLLFKKGKTSEGYSYLNQSFELETDTYKKGKLAYRIGLKLKVNGNYAKATSYFKQALRLNPSNGRPHLSIAAMYASSAKDCGDSNFNKRAVYWLAAQEAQKASRVDPTLSKSASQSAASYNAKAPTKSEIFTAGMSGKTISIGCWIGASVKVPSI